MARHSPIGDFAEALIKILLTVIEKTPAGGATLEELKDAYREVRDREPSDRTIYRAIRRLNLFFDPLIYGEDPEAEEEPTEENDFDSLPPAIEAHRIKGKTRYSFTGHLPVTTIDANQALLVTLGLYTQQKGLLKGHFERVITTLLRSLLCQRNPNPGLVGDIQEHIHVSGFGPADPGKNIRKIQEIMRAIRNRRCIRLGYLRSSDGIQTHRDIEPYGLISRFNKWYLVARCRQVLKRRIFLLEHIKYLEVLETEPFEWPAGFSIHDSYSTAWGVWTFSEDESPELETIRLKIVKGLAERFQQVSFHDSQQVRMLPGGEAEVTYSVTGAKEMIPWLMSWGQAVKVLEPRWLQEALIDNLTQTLQKYN